MEHAFFYEKGKITVTGIVGVETFDEKEARIRLENDVLAVRGEGFVLLDMAQGAGKVSFSGKLSEMEYASKPLKGSFLKKLFK
ncbi:MAG: YabP/YqfC family sporulation protein [Clostridia bacterium]|nr:YabP/YqfC family sporulation protein [Clostridia bacterium]